MEIGEKELKSPQLAGFSVPSDPRPTLLGPPSSSLRLRGESGDDRETAEEGDE
jgi:hypothetical protein